MTKYLLVAIFTFVLAGAGLLTAGTVSAHGGDDNRFEVRRELRVERDFDEDDIDFDDEDELRTELRIRHDLDNDLSILNMHDIVHPSLVHGLGLTGANHLMLNKHLVDGLGFADLDDDNRFEVRRELRVERDFDD